MTNGNNIIEFIESKCGSLEDAYIEQNRIDFMQFAEQEYIESLSDIEPDDTVLKVSKEVMQSMKDNSKEVE